jgi:hypothetical protein
MYVKKTNCNNFGTGIYNYPYAAKKNSTHLTNTTQKNIENVDMMK